MVLTKTDVTRYWHPGYYTVFVYLLVHLGILSLRGLSALINYSSIRASICRSIHPSVQHTLGVCAWSRKNERNMK